MMGSSFALTLARLESMVQKLNIALTNTRYMWETGNADLTYEVAMRLADVAERTVLLARALPACTGNPIAAIEIQNLIDVSIRVDVGFTQEGWFSVRMPLLLPRLCAFVGRVWGDCIRYVEICTAVSSPRVSV